MFNKGSYWIKSGKFSLIERVSILFFGVLNFYFLVRLLDKEQYGTWILYNSIIFLIDIARHGFFRNPLIRFLNFEGDKIDENLQKTSFSLNIILSTITSIGVLIASYPLSKIWKSPELTMLFQINLIINVFYTIFYHAEYLLKANSKFGGSATGYVIKGGIFFIILLFYYISDLKIDLKDIIIYYGISVSIAAIINYLLIRKYFKISFKLDKKWFSRLFGYGKYTLGTNISAVLLRNIDTWMLGYYISPVAVATYNVAVRIASFFEVPSMAMTSILFPEAVKRANKMGDSAFKDLYEKSVAVILLFIIPFILFVFVLADPLVKFIAGEDFIEASEILKVTMLYGLVVPFNKQMGVMMDAIGKAKTNMLFVLRNAVINLILNIISIPVFGIIGAAYATFTTFVISLIINQFYLKKRFNVELLNIARHITYFSSELIKKVFSILKNRL